MGYFTKKPPRHDQEDSFYFLTFCSYHHKSILLLPNIPEIIIQDLNFYSSRLKMLFAYTIMPNHVHMIVEINTISSLSSFLRDFKKHTSKLIRSQLNLHTDHIWQRGTMDHCIQFSYENADMENHLKYIFYNSAKHLKIAPKDFPYHNFMEFVVNGWFDKDFCSFDESKVSDILE